MYFNHTCTAVNSADQTIAFRTPVNAELTDANHLSVNYDLLVGVDGARSAVRSHFLNTESLEFEQKYTPNDHKSIFLPPMDRASDIHLVLDKTHVWRSSDGASIILVPQLDGSMSGVLLFLRQHSAIDRETPAALLQFFNERFPDEYADDWAVAIAQFTIRRQADARALSELSDYSLPSDPKLFVEFMFRQRLAKVLHQVFPDRLASPLMELVFESSIPYSVILHSYRGWIAKVKQSASSF